MSAQNLREFINQHLPSSAGLGALAAALDEHVSGTPLDPSLGARVRELLAAFGVDAALENLSDQERRTFLAEIRHQLPFDQKLLYAETRATSWSYSEESLLQATGEFSRGLGHAVTRNVVPALDGLTERLHAPSAAFLDIGVGVGGLAIQLAELWPNLRVVGLDVWQPSLRLARHNVEVANMGARIELREQSADRLEDEDAFDLAWVPLIFLPERVVGKTTERTLRALRPGGWAVFAMANHAALDARSAALWRLRTTTWGGPLWNPSEVETRMLDHGFVEIRTLPTPPGAPVALVAGRRRPT